MFKRATCLALVLMALLHPPSASAARRFPRSIWPWTASQPEEEPLISEKHAEILRQAGYGDYLDLSSHPVWKVHKYEGIDLKPVQVDNEITKATEARRSPESSERSAASSGVPSSESDVESAERSEEDSSVLDRLRLLYYLLPGFGFLHHRDSAKTDALADAIRDEEQTHPGFFARLWAKLRGGTDPAALEQPADGDEDATLLRIALPPTRQHYAEISLVQPSTRGTRLLVRRLPDQADPDASAGGVEHQQIATVAPPVDEPNSGQQSQLADARVAAVQAYTGSHFRNESTEGQEKHAVTSSDLPETASAGSAVTEAVPTIDQGGARVSTSPKEQQLQSSDAMEQAKWESVKESIVKALSTRILPPKVASKLKDIKQRINDKKAGQESMNELRRLQEEFEARKQQLGPLYPVFRRMIPTLPELPRTSR